LDIKDNKKDYYNVLNLKVGDFMFKWLKNEKEKNCLRFFTYSVYGGLLGIIGIILLCLVISFCSSGFNFNNMFVFGQRPTVIITGSMEPNIKVNSVVMLEPVEFKDIEVGDVIRYTSYRGFSVLHRVIAKNSSYVVTQGDANAKPDEFVVLAEQITGRVKSIHNEVVPVITAILGKFEYGNMAGSVARMGAGFLGLAVFVFIAIVCFIVIFEMITTHYFFKKYNSKLVESSSYWQKKIPSIDGENLLLEKYYECYSKSNIFKKFILAFKFRRYYNGLCNIEKETLKTEKRIKTLTKHFK
jgi:signal peptidase I